MNVQELTQSGPDSLKNEKISLDNKGFKKEGDVWRNQQAGKSGTFFLRVHSDLLSCKTGQPQYIPDYNTPLADAGRNSYKKRFPMDILNPLGIWFTL